MLAKDIDECFEGHCVRKHLSLPHFSHFLSSRITSNLSTFSNISCIFAHFFCSLGKVSDRHKLLSTLIWKIWYKLCKLNFMGKKHIKCIYICISMIGASYSRRCNLINDKKELCFSQFFIFFFQTILFIFEQLLIIHDKVKVSLFQNYHVH